MMGGYALLSVPLYFLGDFEAARQYARRGVEIWRAGGVESQDDGVTEHAISCLFFEAYWSGISERSPPVGRP